jgi:hypothetical protein
MKRGRTTTLAVAITMAAAALSGVVGATAAKAAAYSYLCVIENYNNVISEGQTPAYYCAFAEGSGNTIQMRPESTASMTNWEYPPIDTFESSYEGAIGQAPAYSPCMQVNASGGNTVREAACGDGTPADQAENWLAEPVTGYDGIDGYMFQNEDEPTDCLTYDQSAEILKVGGCGGEWYQVFYAE